MKWIAISGSWRANTKEIEGDVREAVREIVTRGDGIVTGGALGVDLFATDEVLLLDSKAEHIQVFLPATLEIYATHYQQRADEGIITRAQAEELIAQLTRLKKTNRKALIEHSSNTVVDTAAYYERNTEVINHSDELLAFQVNDSKGTQDAIDKMLALGKPVKVRKYTAEAKNL
jgi:uncharacterized phage-like protein YoqJ